MSFLFEARILPGDIPPLTAVVHERRYSAVRVDAAWPEDLEAPELVVALDVRGEVDSRNAPAYAELFFHDLYLLLNLAAPGSFSGTVTTAGGPLRVHELTFRSHVFDCLQDMTRLPLAKVTAWYDGLGIGTQQLATTGVATALFQILRLARAEEDEEISILRLESAARALGILPENSPPPAPVIHPMHDDSLDPRVEDLTAPWVDAADTAARVVITELRRLITE
jgi:hypothetical protein